MFSLNFFLADLDFFSKQGENVCKYKMKSGSLVLEILPRKKEDFSSSAFSTVCSRYEN